MPKGRKRLLNADIDPVQSLVDFIEPIFDRVLVETIGCMGCEGDQKRRERGRALVPT
jgi:hypothetical protein